MPDNNKDDFDDPLEIWFNSERHKTRYTLRPMPRRAMLLWKTRLWFEDHALFVVFMLGLLLMLYIWFA